MADPRGQCETCHGGGCYQKDPGEPWRPQACPECGRRGSDRAVLDQPYDKRMSRPGRCLVCGEVLDLDDPDARCSCE